MTKSRTITATVAVAALTSSLVLLAGPVYACGWWGDAEMSRFHRDDVTAPRGEPLPEVVDQQSAKLPGRTGYGIAVPEPGKAVPYLQATYGRPLNRISELRAFGFAAVIDLGTPEETARLHRAETEAVGMRYFSIPVKGDTPSIEQANLFSQIVYDYSRSPLLVYAPTAPLLGAMWASHRINHGASLDFAINEGRLLGLTPQQESVLRKRAGS